MVKTGKRGLSLLLALVLALSLAAPALAGDDGLRSAVEGSAAYMLEAVKAPQVGSIGGEWAVIGLARSGCAVPQEYWDGYYAGVEDYVASCRGVLHEKKYTEYSRLVLALTAIGADPRNVAGYDLLAPLGDFDKTVWQGVNGPIWALIALDSGNYAMPEAPDAGTQATRQMYVEEILACQLSSGGWNLTDRGGAGEADADVTAMALQALAAYRDQAAVSAAADRALDCLSAMQEADGGFSSWGTANCESTAQVVLALCALGLPVDDARFVKNGHSALDALLGYRLAGGGFRHTTAGSGNDQMASEQGLCALSAALRAAGGKSGIYRMDDVSISVSGAGESAGLPGKHADVKKTAVTAPGTSFGDIAGHKNQAAIEALASRGIINGMGDGSFAPDETMTRAQFAAIVVRALGLPLQEAENFADVPSGIWYAPYVGSAYRYGIVNGRSADSFDPEGTITRQEAAAMVARAAGLCGMDTARSDYEILNALAQFGDYMTISSWARESMAFCYSEDILDQSDLNTEPLRAILRCEIAQMLYNLLDGAKLL